MPDEKNIAMTVREAASQLGVSVQYVYQLMQGRTGKKSKLERWEPPVQGDRTIYVTIASVERLKRERASESETGGTQMNKATSRIRCHRCNHENDPGARVCIKCYARLGDAVGGKVPGGLRARLASIPVGKLLPLGLIIVFVGLLALLSPSQENIQLLLVYFGLLGLVALGVTFPLTKGHYDLSCGPVAGLAACATILATHSEPVLTLPVALTASLIGMIVGVAAGLLNGIIVGWTRISSAVFTIILAVIATEVTYTIATTNRLVIGDPTFEAIGEARFAGIPAPLLLLAAAALATLLLWKRETFWPLSKVSSQKWLLRISAPANIMWTFAVSGLFAGLAGVFIAACALPVISPMGHSTWIIAPLAAAIIGGGVVVAGIGGTGTALLGAAALALIDFFLKKLNVPIAGPVAEGLILLAALMSGRILGLTWYEIQELRRGNLLGIPGAQRLPDLLFHSRYSKAIWAGFTVCVFLTAYTYVAYFMVQYVPENAAAIVSLGGDVRLWETTDDDVALQKTPAPGMELVAGTTIRTGAGARCLLKMSDGTQLQVGQNTAMQIQQIAQENDGTRMVKIRMPVGAMWANVKKLVTPESKFEIETPMLTVAVRGTLFEVEAVAEATKVGVLDGAISLFRYFTERDPYGNLTRREEHGKLLGGEGLTTFMDKPMGPPHPLPEVSCDRMRQMASQAGAEVGRALIGPKFIKSIAGTILLVICVYLIFLFAQGQPRHIMMPEDIDEAARRLETTRTHTADDSPRSVAIAQMHMQTGKREAAQRELQKILDTDPNSQYGLWAQRMISMLMDKGEVEGEDITDIDTPEDEES